jgi:hypothetical protein
MIVTSRSAVSTAQNCLRKRYWQYEAENGTDVRGWERKALAIPLVTGIYVHKGLELALGGLDATSAASQARDLYLAEVEKRGLAVEQGTDEAKVVEEQSAHVEAMVLAWCRVRLPKWLDEYEIVEIEIEDRVPLAEASAKDRDDAVTLAVRADAIVRRKFDHRMFVVNFKTVANADERWLRSWEVDMQLMTELLAAERRYGHQFGGVIIEGILKGARVGVDDRLVEVRGDKQPTAYIDRSKLLYGYKCDADPPLTPLQYQWESTTRKGWYKFRTWQEPFTRDLFAHERFASPLEYWINWLPEEVLEGLFITVPPIMRNEQMIQSKVRQIVAMERRIAEGRQLVDHAIDGEFGKLAVLDDAFPQNEHNCTYPSACAYKNICWESGVADDPAGSGLYQIRVDHHAIKESSNE